MTASTSGTLFDLGDRYVIERMELDGYVAFSLGGRPLFGYRADDVVGRDLVIGMLRTMRVPGKEVAKLSGMSTAHVSGIRKRMLAEGIKSITDRRKEGRPTTLSAKQMRCIERERRAGATYAEIASSNGVTVSSIRRHLARVGVTPSPQQSSLLLDAPPTPTLDAAAQVEEVRAETTSDAAIDPRDAAEAERAELLAARPLVPSALSHRTPYAGTMLLAAGLCELGVRDALETAGCTRPKKSLYDATTITFALACAWGSGFASLESMHERDAHGLGIVLGLERSPSVRTLHRAIGQMTSSIDLGVFGDALMRGLRRSLTKAPTVFGIDGHFKAYSGKAPIDKGWDSKRRLATKGLLDMVITDTQGRTWTVCGTPAGDSLSRHVLDGARALRQALGPAQDVVLAFDRGGFDFEVLNALAKEGFSYISWVPFSVNLPDLAQIAPSTDGLGQAQWMHTRLSHPARLMVQRDGEDLVPATTNLPSTVASTTAMRMLRRARGMQENAFKAARVHAHIDRLSDRGGARIEPDTRLVEHPEHRKWYEQLEELTDKLGQLDACDARCTAPGATMSAEAVVTHLEHAVAKKRLKEIPARVARIELDPNAKRAFLKTRNRALLLPMKYAAENARRWWIDTLASALAPSDAEYDESAVTRTLTALLQAPGTVQIGVHDVCVTLDLQLPPKPHQRLANALVALDRRNLKSPDGARTVRFRLEPRVTRERIGVR